MKRTLLLLLAVIVSSVVAAEDISNELETRLGKMIAVKTSGGGIFRGELLSVTETRIELINSDGTITSLHRKMLKSAEELIAESGGKAYFEDSAANRLIIMPTGFGMDKGEFHIAAHEIIVINATYGFSRNFSLWSGITILGAVFNARGSFQIGDKIGVSAGTFAAVSWMEQTRMGLIPYVIFSRGTENKNFTMGVGIPFGSFQHITYPTIEGEEPIVGPRQNRLVGAATVLAGKIPLSPTTAIITENWIVIPYDGKTWDTSIKIIPMAVIRIGGPRLTWDIGATLPVSIDKFGLGSIVGGKTLIPVPLLSLTYRIN